MIRVTVELVSGWNEERVIGTMRIVNVGGDHRIGQYTATIGVHTVEIHDYPRKLEVWELIQRSIKEYFREVQDDKERLHQTSESDQKGT